MTRFILARIPLLFVILFVSGSAVAIGYQVMYAGPEKACEEKGMWWAARWRQCVAPIEIEKLTGRPNPTPEVLAAEAATPGEPAAPTP